MIRPYKYQFDIARRGYKKLLRFGMVYLAMEVRTGKTITALLIAEKYENVLFITKKKAIASVRKDMKRLGLKYNLEVINYESIHKRTIKNPELIILDEAHSLGMFPKPAQKTKTLKSICMYKPIIYLSGTPSPESYSQLYHQLWVSSRSPFKGYQNFYKWAKDYVIIKQKRINHGQMVNDYSNARKEQIFNAIKHVLITWNQKQAGIEQQVQERILKVELNPITRRMMEDLKRDKLIMTPYGQIIADNAACLLGKIHQLCGGTVIMENDEAVILDTSKAVFINKNFIDDKIAIFYKYKAEGKMLKSHFNWTDNPEVFNNSNDKVFIGQIRANREGIALNTADYILMYNIDFSATSYFQARARMQKRDRTKPAVIIWLFGEGTIEPGIYNRVKDKKNYTTDYFTKTELL